MEQRSSQICLNKGKSSIKPIVGNALIFPELRRAAASALPLEFRPPTQLWTIPCCGATSAQPSHRMD
uniref:Uncharacterized protein n=1 Tax=Leersia perrieri TaxID=77586 RepID=A0A0D9V9R2_9ORYZ